jgi:hypothetical protein
MSRGTVLIAIALQTPKMLKQKPEQGKPRHIFRPEIIGKQEAMRKLPNQVILPIIVRISTIIRIFLFCSP